MRFRAEGLRSRRRRLGLSAADYGRLVGVAGQTIYQWEMFKARPRRGHVASLAAGRGGTADNTLSLMVKARTLKRKNLLDERGSRYTPA